MAGKVFVHPQALNESVDVGDGTRIWAFAHVMAGARVGRDCNLGDHAFVEGGAVVGNGVTIKNGVCVWEGVTLADHVFVGPQVAFTNDRYPRSPRAPAARERYSDKRWLVPTHVGEGASIGSNATIVCGVTIGRYSMVAAGAVVSRDVRDFRIVAGCPAREVGYACICGQPLCAEGPFRCRVCNRDYTEENGTLRPA